METPSDLEMDELEGSTHTLISDDDTPDDTEVSELAAEESQHAKPGAKGGRTRKDGIKPGIVDVDLPIPTPRYRVFKSDATNPNQSSKTAWNYANTLPAWAKSKIVYYVYRDWPVLIDPGFDEEQEVYDRQYKYIDKISGDTPIQDDMDLLHRYGCGTYRVVAKDASTKRKIDKPVFTVWVMNIGGSDYKSNPPTDQRINDVEQVDLGNPANKSYVAYLRGMGKLPEQIDGKVKEHEMATIEAMKESSAQQGVLVKEIISMAKDRSQSSENSSKAQAEVMADTIKTSNDMTREAAKQSIGMVKEAFDQAKAMLPTAATVAPSQDPVTVARDIIKLLKEGSNPNDSEIALLRAQLNQMQQAQVQTQQAQITALQDQIKTLIEAKVTTPAQTSSPFAAMKEGLESLEQFNDVMGRLKGNKEESEEVVDAVADVAPKWLRPMLPFVPGLMQGAISFFNMRMQQPQPTYYQTADGRILPIQVAPQPQPQQQIPGRVVQMQPHPQNPYAPPNPNPVPPPPSSSQDPIYQLLSSISVPLLNSLQVGGTGTDFADWFIGGYGEAVFEEVAKLGPDMLLTAISTFPPISQNGIFVQADPAYVRAFVAEFCDPKFPDNGGEDEEEGGGTGKPAGPTPA